MKLVPLKPQLLALEKLSIDMINDLLYYIFLSKHHILFVFAGSYVTHETNHFVYFYLDQKAVLLFKSG